MEQNIKNNPLDYLISLRDEKEYQKVKEEMCKYALLFDILESIMLWKN